MDFDEKDFLKSLADFKFNIIFLNPANIKVVLKFDSNKKSSEFFVTSNDGGKNIDTSKAAFDKSIELMIPFFRFSFA